MQKTINKFSKHSHITATGRKTKTRQSTVAHKVTIAWMLSSAFSSYTPVPVVKDSVPVNRYVMGTGKYNPMHNYEDWKLSEIRKAGIQEAIVKVNSNRKQLSQMVRDYHAEKLVIAAMETLKATGNANISRMVQQRAIALGTKPWNIKTDVLLKRRGVIVIENFDEIV